MFCKITGIGRRPDMDEKYARIARIAHSAPEGRKHMSNYDRAAQFAPFAALTGYEDAVFETARVTDARPELADDEAREIDSYLKMLKAGIADAPCAGVTYFVPDKRKAGGRLIDKIAPAVRIDEKEGAIVFEDGSRVRFCDIVSVTPAITQGLGFGSC